jgi:hypothetical protein
MPEPSIVFDWLDLLRRRVAKDKNNLVVFVGQTGSGKSWAALDAARKMDPQFSINHVHFTIEDFLDDIADVIDAREDGRTVCQTLILDEAAVGFNARKSMHGANIDFADLLAIFRYLNLTVFFTFPTLESFDVAGRRLIHFIVDMTGIDDVHGTSYAHLLMIDARRSFGQEPKRFKVVIDIENLGSRFQLDPIRFDKPPETLLKAYKVKKEKFGRDNVDRMRRKGRDAPAEADPEEPIPGIPIPQILRRKVPRL